MLDIATMSTLSENDSFLYEEILNNVPYGIVLLENFIIKYANSSFYENADYKEDLAGKHISIFLNEKDNKLLINTIKSKRKKAVLKLKRPDKTFFYVSCFFSYLTDSTVQISITYIDKNIFFSNFINNLEEMVFLKDDKSHYIYANDKFCDFLKLNKKDVVGSTDADILDKNIFDIVKKSDKEALRSNIPFRIIESIESKKLDVLKFKIPIGSAQLGLGGIVRNITEDVNRQKYLQYTKNTYEQLFHMFSHEFESKEKHIQLALNKAMLITKSDYGCISLIKKSSKEFESFYHNFSNDKIMESKKNRIKMFGHDFCSQKNINEEYHINNCVKNFIIQEKNLFDKNIVIKREMYLPIYEGKTIVGIIWLANKFEDYTLEDVRIITLLITGVWNTINNNLNGQYNINLLSQMRSMFNNHGAVMLVIDPKSGKILDNNPAAVKFYGYNEEELHNMCIQDINILDEEAIEKLRLKALRKKQKTFTFPHKLKNGDIRFVDVYSSPIYYRGKDALYSIIFDVTERETSLEQIKKLSNRDYLTNLFNRRYFEKAYQKLNDIENFPLGIVNGDVNKLKVVNDSLGHTYGDQLIIKAAEIIRRVFGEKAIVSRVGGDEFSVIILKADKIDITNKLKEIDKLCNEAEIIKNHNHVLSIAFGYAIQDFPGQGLESMIKVAEKYLYVNKHYDRRSLRSNTIDFILNTLFEKSERERNHSKRVSEIAGLIAKKMNFSDNKINRIKTAGELHDIGKIGVNIDILNKPDKLTDQEWKEMKAHAERSYRILDNTYEFSYIANAVRYHHERWDGFGYPAGLKGEEIPYDARIIALADSYDAMVNDRPYKKGISKEEAKVEIKKYSGSQFDPILAKNFIEIIDSL